LTLSAFLVGLASGSRQAGRHCATLPREAVMQRAIDSLMIASLIGLLFLPLLGQLAALDGATVGLALLLVHLFSRFWGALLPYLAEVGVGADARAGMRTALLYLANIVGSAAGSILTGFVLMDHVDLVTLAVALVVAGLICAALLAAALRIPRPAGLKRAGLAAVLGLLAAVAVPLWSQDLLDRLPWKSFPPNQHLAPAVE